MNYREEKTVTAKYKQEYVDGIKRIIAEKQKVAETVRDNYAKNILKHQESYRNDFKEMLGWPLVGHQNDSLSEVISEKLAEEDGYSVYRMQFEILDGLRITGLFFKCNGDDKKPLVIVQHGGQGTPELISGVYDDTANYNDMLMRVRKHKVHTFAPQLLLWHDDYNVEFDRKGIDADLKRVGSSITAIEIYGIMRILDYFENKDYVSNFGMVGLSYGGFYTLFTAAIDTRIKSAISCSYFNRRETINWSDWTWHKSLEKFTDVEIACLIYPRKLYIEVGDKDELFDFKESILAFEKLKDICKNVKEDWVEFKVFDGHHSFYRNDEHIEKLIADMG